MVKFNEELPNQEQKKTKAEILQEIYEPVPWTEEDEELAEKVRKTVVVLGGHESPGNWNGSHDNLQFDLMNIDYNLERYSGKETGIWLDMGVGNGQWTEALENKGFTTFGTSILVEETNNTDIFLCNNHNLCFKDESFDFVSMSWANDRKRFPTNFEKSLKEAHRVLKENGLIYIKEGNLTASNVAYFNSKFETLDMSADSSYIGGFFRKK